MIRLLSVWLILSISIIGAVSQAADFGVEAGVRSQSGDAGASGFTAESKTGFQLGGVGQFPLSGEWYIRSGLLYTQRNVDLTYKAGGTTSTGSLTMTYFDVPLQGLYKFEDYGSVFAGPLFSMILDKKCQLSNGNTCTVTSAKSMLIPFQLGATFKFMPQVGATIYYETIPGDIADNFGNYRAIGANLLFTFD